MRVLLKVFCLKPSLLVVAAVGEPKLLEELVFINFFWLVSFSAIPTPLVLYFLEYFWNRVGS